MFKTVHISEVNITEWLRSDRKKDREKAWNYIYKQYFPMIKGFVLNHSGTSDEALDIFQETVCVLIKKAKESEFTLDTSLQKYFMGVARNLWYLELRSKNKELETEELVKHAMEIDQSHYFNEKLIEQLVEELPPNCKKILKEFYFNKKSMEEIKKIFGYENVQSAKNKKHRCLNRLANLIDERNLKMNNFVIDYDEIRH